MRIRWQFNVGDLVKHKVSNKTGIIVDRIVSNMGTEKYHVSTDIGQIFVCFETELELNVPVAPQ